MKKLVLFNEKYNLDEYDKKSLPEDIYNSAGAILSHKGQKLSKGRLMNSFIMVEDSFIPENIITDDLFNTDIENLLREAEDTFSEIDEPVEEKKSEKIVAGGSSISSQELEVDPLDDLDNAKNEVESPTLNKKYIEENAEQIDAKINDLKFKPIPDVKFVLRQNVYQIKDIFEKKIVDDVVNLASKENEKISKKVVAYIDKILTKNLYASDYIDMINSIRNEDNYLTFSHACSVAFYSISIMKKLRIIKEDYFLKRNLGKWKSVRTKKNNEEYGLLDISNQLLKYVDLQKEIISIKYDGYIKNELFERLHDILYLYHEIDPSKKYPSFSINLADQNREFLAIAALNHDIGKMRVPEEILTKRTRLTRNEFKIMAKHPIYSVNLLQEAGVKNNRVLAYILGHHRLTDEMGYPPLKKEAPYEAKIIAIADIYDAMRSPKHYNTGVKQDEALKHIQNLYEQGAFDYPLYVAALHTFEEYNHDFVLRRKSKSMEILD